MSGETKLSMSTFLYERLKTLMEGAFFRDVGECSTVVLLEFWWYYKQGMCWQGLSECSWHHEYCNCELHCSWWNNLAQVGHQEINYGGIDTWKYQLEESVGPEF